MRTYCTIVKKQIVTTWTNRALGEIEVPHTAVRVSGMLGIFESHFLGK